MKKIYSLTILLFSLQINAQCWQSIPTVGTHTISIKPNGTLWAWGNNSYNQLANGTNTNESLPIQIGTSSNWQKIANQGEALHNMAIKTDGTLWAWGYNAYGQLGDGTNTNRTTPIQIGTANNWNKVAAGGHYTCNKK